ncbi:unnamed protein product [Natator depressus]
MPSEVLYLPLEELCRWGGISWRDAVNSSQSAQRPLQTIQKGQEAASGCHADKQHAPGWGHSMAKDPSPDSYGKCPANSDARAKQKGPRLLKGHQEEVLTVH